MIEFLIIWFVLGFIGYVWYKVGIYNHEGEVEFGWDDLWCLPTSMILGLTMLCGVMYRLGYFNKPWFVIKRRRNNMGMQIGGALIVGLEYNQFLDRGVNEELLETLLDDGELDYASPWYDAPKDQWFVGAELSNGTHIYDNIFISQEDMKGVTDSLDKLLGVKLTYRLRACAHVY